MRSCGTVLALGWEQLCLLPPKWRWLVRHYFWTAVRSPSGVVERFRRLKSLLSKENADYKCHPAREKN